MSERERWKVVVVLDDEATRRQLRRRIAAQPAFQLVADCASGVDGIRALRNQRIDFLVSGARLADLDGFEMLEIAGREALPAAIVIVSASEDGAARAFELGAVDFLRMPVDAESLARSLERVAERLETRRERGRSADPGGADPGLASRPRRGFARRLVARSGDRWVVVPVDTVSWIESDGNYVRLHCGEQSYRLRSSIGELERQLDPESFFRVHRSTIVRLDQVGELALTERGDYRVQLRDGSEVDLTRARREAFVAALEGLPESAESA